jgi:hypothetical protein
MSDNGNLFSGDYKDFLKRRGQEKGYDFQEAPAGSAAPPTVTFAQKLRWWTWDRWKRRKKIRAERDRRLQNIVQLAQGPAEDTEKTRR